jgi:hypothetical protein
LPIATKNGAQKNTPKDGFAQKVRGMRGYVFYVRIFLGNK